MRRFRFNYWMNRTNYFGDGLWIGLLTGTVFGILIGNLAANMVLFTFAGGAVGSFIKRRR